jgi:hypothetical protein
MWRYLRQFPKFIIAGLIIAGSLTVLFVWKARHASEQTVVPAALVLPPQVKDTKAQEAQVEYNHERLILVDNELYDIDTGAVVFKAWLAKEMPERLFYDADSKKLIAQYELGFVRYNLDGTVEATLLQQFKPAVSKDLKWMLYVKDKDIWRADIDWNDFKLVNERQITSIEQFWPQNFAENIFFWTDKSLVVRNLANLLGVNLETGNVKPVRIPLDEIAKRRSPDGERLVGVENGEFYCYDLESNTTKTVRIGRLAINDYQWIGNDKCVVIVAGRAVVSYDRLNNTFNEVLQLPMICSKIQEPSPDGRFVFCSDWKGEELVDLEKRTAAPFTGGAGVEWVNNDTVISSREVPDTDLRGTWLQTMGEKERRVSPEPYLVSHTGGSMMAVPSAGVVVFATQYGLSKMRPDGSELGEFAALAHPPIRALAIQDLKQ